MILDTQNANAIMDALADDTPVRVYDAREKFLALGKVTKVYKNGFAITGEIAPIIGTQTKTFFWKDALTVVPA